MTPSALSPPSAPRVRRPSKRYQEYDQDADEGSLVTFSQSVGVHIPPPEPGTFTSEQVKKQRAIAIARGNATRPAPLSPPPKRHKANDPRANDYQFEELDTEEDRMEWLYQALESLGTKKNYREDLEFDDSAILFEVYEDLRLGGGANRDDTPLPTPKPQIKTGMTKTLEHHKSGLRLSAKLVPTDNTTIGLDGRSPHAYHRKEFGQPVAPKLTRTDHTTLGLGGTPALLPGAKASRHAPTSNPSTKSQGHKPPLPSVSTPKNGQPKPSSVPTRPANKPAPAPSQKHAVVPRARIEAIRKENAARQAGKGSAAGTGTAAKGVPASSDSALKPSHARQPPAFSNAEMEGPLPPTPQARGASPVDDNVNDEIDDEIDDDANDDNDNDNTNDDEGQGRGSKHAKREDMLLRTFGPDATPLVQYLVTNLKIEMPAVCGYPEHVKSIDHPNRPQLEAWLTKLWVAANMKYRPDQPRLPFQDSYGYYVRKQCAPIRNHVKKWAEPMVGSYYNLNRAHPNHAEKARDLIDGHKWLSPTLANDKHVFKHPIISNTITYAFFRTSRSVGSKNLERFTPLVPIETIAYVCAIIRHLIMAFLTKDEHASDLNAKDNADNFRMYLDMLKRIEDSDEAALKNIRSGITLAYLKTRTKPNLLPPIQLNLGPRQEVDMEAMHEIQELLGDDAPDIDEWAAVSKGKGRASRTGPSRAC